MDFLPIIELIVSLFENMQAKLLENHIPEILTLLINELTYLKQLD